MDTRIYIMTHKSFEFPEGIDERIYQPLHVGRVLGTDLGYPGDDEGDSISEKNRNFCELTGMFWVWKNVSCDVVGVAHYRRYLINPEKNMPLTKDLIESWLSDHDILLSVGCYVDEDSIYDNFKKWHHIEDMDICRDVVGEKFPEYLPAFDLAMASRLFSGGNMLIAPKRIYNAYCDWLFSVLFEVEKRVDITGYDTYQSRLFGFLAERLVRVFVLGNEYRIKEVRVGEVK